MKYVLKEDFIIKKGTELKLWKDWHEAVIGIHKDGVAYFRADEQDLLLRPDLFEARPNKQGRAR